MINKINVAHNKNIIGDMPPIHIDGKELKVKYSFMHVEDLQYFPENPRILSIILQNPNIKNDRKKITEILWGKNQTHDLYQRILSYGGLKDPVIVWKNQVLEGNTRLCCFIKLKENYPNGRFDKINCQIIDEPELDRSLINHLLSDEHIIRKAEWGSYEKGCWMNQLITEEKYKIEDVAKMAQKSSMWVKQQIDAYRTMVSEKINEPEKYSHFVQLESNQRIKEIERKNPGTRKKIIKLIKENRVPVAQDIRKIPRIFKDKKTWGKAVDGELNVAQASVLLEAEQTRGTLCFIEDVEKLTKRMKNLKSQEIDSLRKKNVNFTAIKKLYQEAISLCDDLKKNKK